MTLRDCTPVRASDAGMTPCNGQAAPSDPSALPELTRTLNTDAKDINKAANDLQTFTVLGIKRQEVTSYENETVLDVIVGIPESCSSNDFDRQVADYIVSRDTVHYSTELILQYFEIQKALPTAESTSNNSN
nr:hypothetical protein BaRGS_023772 [Batillaria attramentaria]